MTIQHTSKIEVNFDDGASFEASLERDGNDVELRFELDDSMVVKINMADRDERASIEKVVEFLSGAIAQGQVVEQRMLMASFDPTRSFAPPVAAGPTTMTDGSD